MEIISIIVPIYKIKEEYLCKCIESICNQTYREIEIILVDDGSPDDCGKICDQYAEKDSRIIVIHQINQGVSAARNNGILRASGKWIVFVDADDWIESYMCERAIKAANLEKSDMVVWNTYYNSPQGQKVRKNYERDIVVKDKDIFEKINLNFLRTISIKKNEIRIPTLESPTCHLFRRDIIIGNHITYDETLKQGEDKLFNYEYHMYIHSMVYINEPMYHYRLHSESTTHTFFAENADTSTRILKKYYELEPRIKVDKRYRNAYNIRVGVIAYFLIGKYFLNPGNYLPGDKYREFAELMKTEPYVSALPQIDLKEVENLLNKIKLWMFKHRRYRSVFLYYKFVEKLKR